MRLKYLKKNMAKIKNDRENNKGTTAHKKAEAK